MGARIRVQKEQACLVLTLRDFLEPPFSGRSLLNILNILIAPQNITIAYGLYRHSLIFI
jgi:hypothetical protein